MARGMIFLLCKAKARVDYLAQDGCFAEQKIAVKLFCQRHLMFVCLLRIDKTELETQLFLIRLEMLFFYTAFDICSIVIRSLIEYLVMINASSYLAEHTQLAYAGADDRKAGLLAGLAYEGIYSALAASDTAAREQIKSFGCASDKGDLSITDDDGARSAPYEPAPGRVIILFIPHFDNAHTVHLLCLARHHNPL